MKSHSFFAGLAMALLCLCMSGSAAVCAEEDPGGVYTPDVSLYLNTDRLTVEKGILEYSFYTEEFQYNDFALYDHKNIRIKESKAEKTRWQMLNSGDVTYGEDGEAYLNSWCGVVYTGGISKTQGTKKTLVENPNGDEGLFSVRYRGAVIDRDGKLCDLVLSFDKVSFTSETDVEGPLPIMEGSKLVLAPNLYENGEYLLVAKDYPEATKIGAKFEFRYRIETAEGELPKAMLVISAGDRKTRGTASLEIVSGAAGRAGNPRDDDSGNVLIYPEGAMTATLSCKGRGREECALFTADTVASIVQSTSEGGRVCYVASSPPGAETPAESEAYLSVWEVGESADYRIVPDRGYAIQSIWIDNILIPFQKLNWEKQSDGSAVAKRAITERYGTRYAETEYSFVKETDGSVRFRFEDIQESHSLYVEFEKPIWLLLKRLRMRKKYWSLTGAFVSGAVCLATVLWMGRKEKKSHEK